MNDDSYTDRSTGLHDKVIQVHSTRACIAPLPGPAVQRLLTTCESLGIQADR